MEEEGEMEGEEKKEEKEKGNDAGVANLCLPVKALLVPYHLEGDVLVGLVVVDLEDLPEGALADHLQDLVPGEG